MNFDAGHSKHPFPTNRDGSIHGYQQVVMTKNNNDNNNNNFVFCSQSRRSTIQPVKPRPGVACGSDHELLIVKFRLKLKKVGKTTRPFRYDLKEKVPYDNSVEVMNTFKGLDLMDRLPEELWMDVHNIVQEAMTKTVSKKKKYKKGKWLSEEALQIAEERR